ncbi:MAG: ubiquitin-conjugating enzyme E2 [Promethearchaeota archaeon]
MPELPFEIWKDRIDNEIKGLERLNVLEKESVIKDEDAVEMIINIDAFGFIKEMGELKPKKSHRIYLKINRSFPYPGGIDFSWYSPIYHPNIHPVQLDNGKPGTGYICLNVLKKWSRLSDLDTTVKALKMLVENPNPEDPLNYDVCLDATEFFKNNSMEELKKRYDFQSTEDEDNNDIIILDD